MIEIGGGQIGVDDVLVPALGDVLPVFLEHTEGRVTDTAHAGAGDAEAGFVGGDDLAVARMDEKAQAHEVAVDEIESCVEFQSARALGFKAGAFAGWQALGGLNNLMQPV